jgi:hypothetical protein
MKPVKLGIVGCGVIGTHHVTEATKSSVVDSVAVSDMMEKHI